MGSSSFVIHDINDASTLEAIAYREAISLAEYVMLKKIVKNIEKGSHRVYGNIISEINRRSQMYKCTFFSRSSC